MMESDKFGFVILVIFIAVVCSIIIGIVLMPNTISSDAYTKAIQRDDDMLKEINNSATCEIMNFRLEKYNDYFLEKEKTI